MQEPKRGVQQGSQVGGVAQDRRPIRSEVPPSPAPQARRPVENQREVPVRPQAAPDRVRREAPSVQKEQPKRAASTPGQPREGNPAVNGRQNASSKPQKTNSAVTKQEMSSDMRAEVRSREGGKGHSSFLPILGLALTLLLLAAFQTAQLSMDRDVLVTVKNNQDAAVSESKKVRTQFESIAKSTGQLAANGNSNAQMIVEQLRKQGITINLDSASAR